MSVSASKKGIFPTMITPYTADGQVDLNGVEALVEWYWKKGCEGIFALCQSSEIRYLSLDERLKIGKCVLDKAKALAKADKSRPPMTIVASSHVSDDFEAQVNELTATAELGFDCLILITNRLDIENTSDEKWIEDLNRLVARLPKDVSLGLYECPLPYKRLLTEKMLKACKETGRFTFCKDTCCDASEIKKRIQILEGSTLGLYNANAQTLLETWRAGAVGYSGVMANFHPELYRYLFAHQNEEPSDLLQSFICLSAFTEVMPYPATAKYYLNEFEGVPIQTYSRSVDHTLLTDYHKDCLRQMKLLSDKIKEDLKID